MKHPDLLRRIQPSPNEFAFHVIFVILATGLFTVIDINVHINYVNPLLAECYESNNSELCFETRERAGILDDPSNQLAIGDTYWGTLLGVVLTIGMFFGAVRIVMGLLAGDRHIRMLILIGVLWFWGTVAFFYFGYLDFGYYFLRGEMVDDVLPWLDGVGLFKYVQPFGATEHVDRSDLYILMMIGIPAFLLPWYWMIHHHKIGTLKRMGLD